MGKKMSKASIKFSNNYNQKKSHRRHWHHQNHHRHHQLNTLRPRVYITRSSGFKTLVQELTGYDHTAANPPVLSAIPPPPPEARSPGLQINCNDQHTDNNDHDCNSHDNMLSFDDLDSHWLAPPDNTNRLSDELLGSQQQPPSFVPKTANQVGLSQDMNMESWLLEIGPSAYMLD